MMKKRGVSLVELMIVVVLMGLLGTVVASGGQLIKAAKIRSIITKITLYEESVLAFKSAYGYLPGDFPKTSIWLNDQVRDNCGILVGSPDTHTYKTGSDATELNNVIIAGNGDGYVFAWDASGDLGDAQKVMCHLILSDLMPRDYKNFATISSFFYEKKADVSSCRSGVVNSYYCTGAPVNEFDGLVLIGDSGDADVRDSEWHLFGNVIYLKNIKGRPSSYIDDTTIPIQYLVSVDNKIDDGKPGDGKIVLGARTKNLCDNNLKAFCAPGSVLSNKTKTAILAYRPNWLNNEWHKM